MAGPSSALWRLVYQGVDITRDLRPHFISVSYTDAAHGESDKIEIRLHDRSGLWKADWKPTKGDRVSLAIGYEGADLVPCGDFEIDQMDYEGPPDQVSLQGLATGITPSLRTSNVRAYEGRTLRQVARTIADAHDLRVTGEIDDVQIGRITQNQERDLAFLKRLASSYRHVFTVKGDQLVFHRLEDLEAASPVRSIRRAQMSSYRFTEKTQGIYRDAVVSYHDPDTKQLIEHKVEQPGQTKGDTLRIRARIENQAQAEKRASSELANANQAETSGSISLPGDPYLVAGSNVTIEGFFTLDGKFEIEKSTHRLDRSGGYKTELEVRRVG